MGDTGEPGLDAPMDDSLETLNPTSLDVRPNTNNLKVGDERQLTTTFEPEGAASDLEWSVADASVASVEWGLVTALGVGSTTITATTPTGVTDTVELSVTEAEVG